MLCHSRTTREIHAKYYPDGIHKFYLELRCNAPCHEDLSICVKCLERYDAYHLQYTYKFEHGTIYDPIPERSHIYGGAWYTKCAARFGQPPPEIIALAEQYQFEARNGTSVAHLLSKVVAPSTSMKEALAQVAQVTQAPIKRVRKPKVATTNAAATIAAPIAAPIPAPIAEPIPAPIAAPIPAPIADEVKPKKKSVPRKKPVAKQIPERIHKEVTLPTHIEKTLEVFDTDEYEIVHVMLTPFELNDVHYFRDPSKNKLFQKKGKGMGEYVGRYDPYTESLVTDIPDSDDET